MILLLTNAPAAGQCAESLLMATKKKVHVASGYREAIDFLRDHDVTTVVFDEGTLEEGAGNCADLLKHAGAAIAVRVNFAVHNLERIQREVQDALRRYQRERVVAQKAARGELASQFTGEVTAILVASQLAMEEPTLSGDAKEKVGEVCRIAERLRDRLKTSA